MSQNSSNRIGRINRRQFVSAVGGAGLSTTVAGCLGDDDDPGDGDVDGDPDEDDTILQWAASPDEAENLEDIQSLLWDAGLSEDIYLEVVAGSEVTDNRRSQYTQWLNSELAEPDILLMDSGWAMPFIVRGDLLNLSDELSGSQLSRIEDDYFPGPVSTATDVGGDLYALPLWNSIPTIQYRKDLVEDAGYDPEGEDWATESISWEYFSEVISTVHDENDLNYGYTFQADAYEGLACCTFNEMMTSWGGAYFGDHENLFGPVGERPVTVNEEETHNAVRMARTFIHGDDDPEALDGVTGDISPDAVLQWTEEESRRPFTDGNALAHRNWPYSIGINGDEENFGEDLGVMPIPYGVPEGQGQYEGTGGPVAAQGGWHLGINPYSEKIDAALEVVEAMMATSFKIGMFEVDGWLPVEPEIFQSDDAEDLPVMGRYLDSLAAGAEVANARPVTEVWPQQSDIVAQEVNAALAQQKSTEEAMADLEESLVAIEE